MCVHNERKKKQALKKLIELHTKSGSEVCAGTEHCEIIKEERSKANREKEIAANKRIRDTYEIEREEVRENFAICRE